MARSLPEPKRTEVAQRVRTEFRAPVAAGGSEGISQARLTELLEEAESKIGWIKIVTPKELRRGAPQGQSGKSSFVMVDGQLQPRDGATGAAGHTVVSAFGEGNIDPEALRRHQNLIKRQHFAGGGLRRSQDGRGNTPVWG
jgi:hypothetical protein